MQAKTPNVVLIQLDDVGFGHPSTFGGPVCTPALQHLADQGLRYNRFHAMALSSATRAALLGGRNRRSVRTGCFAEIAANFPGFDATWAGAAASVAEILDANGYATATFDYWFGFRTGEPGERPGPAFERATHAGPAREDPRWHFSETVTDRAITWIRQQRASVPKQPFFVFFAPGACHAPHHVREDWAKNYGGRFDCGWDRQREETFENQKKLGLVPMGTKAGPRPGSIPPWTSRSPEEKRSYARMQELFAGFLEHIDHQIGRLVDAVDGMGLRDDTLFIYIVGDSGPSAGWFATGALDAARREVGLVDDVLEPHDAIGRARATNHYPAGWAWAGSTPFQSTRKVAAHFGGTRNGLVISWPNGIDDRGGLRSQFHHVVDIVPTLLEVAGIPEPREFNGVPQHPIEGVSMAYSFADKDAPSRRITQYFEMFGNRALYHDGWVAGCLERTPPWETAGTAAFDDDTWELYNIEEDFSQASDLAATQPRKLRELQERLMAEAAKYNLLPPDDRLAPHVRSTNATEAETAQADAEPVLGHYGASAGASERRL